MMHLYLYFCVLTKLLLVQNVYILQNTSKNKSHQLIFSNYKISIKVYEIIVIQINVEAFFSKYFLE